MDRWAKARLSAVLGGKKKKKGEEEKERSTLAAFTITRSMSYIQNPEGGGEKREERGKEEREALGPSEAEVRNAICERKKERREG